MWMTWSTRLSVRQQLGLAKPWHGWPMPTNRYMWTRRSGHPHPMDRWTTPIIRPLMVFTGQTLRYVMCQPMTVALLQSLLVKLTFPALVVEAPVFDGQLVGLTSLKVHLVVFCFMFSHFFINNSHLEILSTAKTTNNFCTKYARIICTKYYSVAIDSSDIVQCFK